MQSPQLTGASGSGGIALISDIHVGTSEIDETPYAWVETFTNDVLAADPSLILIAGDIFDKRDGSVGAIEATKRMFDRLSADGRHVALIAGNHDRRVQQAFTSVEKREDITVFPSNDAATNVFDVRCGSAIIYIAVHGISVAEPKDLRDVLPLYPAPVTGAINIGMLHTSLSGERSKSPCLPMTFESLLNGPAYDAWLLGHVHDELVLSENPLILYPGGAHPRFVEANEQRLGRKVKGFKLLHPTPGGLLLEKD